MCGPSAFLASSECASASIASPRVSLPETLGEAIDALAHSELAKKALGPHIFDRYVELKRKEWDEYRVQLTDWERDRYLAVLEASRPGARKTGQSVPVPPPCGWRSPTDGHCELLGFRSSWSLEGDS